MNNIVVQGNLVAEVVVKQDSKGYDYCYGKIGVYNGMDKDGVKKPSMFMQFTLFGRDVELIKNQAVKGSALLLSGSLSREDVTAENGIEYVNLKITARDAKICEKPRKVEPADNDLDGWE